MNTLKKGENMNELNQKIKCDVFDCKHCNCDDKVCNLKEIKVCNCSHDDTKEATMCYSFKSRK